MPSVPSRSSKLKKIPSGDLKPVRPLWQWLTILGILVLVLGVGGFGGVWIYRAAQVWRAHALVKEAKALIEQKRRPEAETKLLAANHLASHDAEVVRACASFELDAMNAYALGFYQILLGLPEVTKDDQRAALRACLAFGNLAGAQALADALTAKDPSAEDYTLKGQVLWQQRLPKPAVELMRQSLTMDPENRSHRLILAQMLAAIGGQENTTEAMNLLRALAEKNDSEGLKALETLSRNRSLNEAEQRTILAQLQAHTLLDDEGRFSAWELKSHLSDQDPKAVMQEALDFFKTADLPRKAVAARWLYGQGQPEMALQLAKEPDTMANQDLLLVQLDALASLNRWPEVVTELNEPQLPLSQTFVFLYRARAAKELGDPEKSRSNWERARNAAASEPGRLAYLGNYAMQTGNYEEALKTFTAMTQIPDQSRAGYASMLQLLAQRGTTAQLREGLKKMMIALPEDLDAKSDWAYLSLLLNQDVDQAMQIAQQLVQAKPELLAYRSTLALAYLRKQQFQSAEDIYHQMTTDWPTAPDGWKMVHAVVLAANGKKDEAAAFARTINRSRLREEERALLNTYLPGI